VAELPDGDWAEAWREHFRPTPVGRALLVAPPWERPPANGRVVITIEPGRAFGTGQHGSTAGCLTTLEAILESRSTARATGLGSGSGILAIAAARLGVPVVIAVDDDPDAVASAVANVARNGVCDRVRCVLGDARDVRVEPAPLVMANILAAAHLELAPRYARLVLPAGRLVLGGVLDAEGPAVAKALERHGFDLRASFAVDGWTTLELLRTTATPSPDAPLHHRA
jgi:ribosomal protein L11 methyltransferase